MFQELWSCGLQWDDQLPDDVVETWRSWKEELLHVHKIKIPRYFAIGLAKDAGIELHAFCDASSKAFSSVYMYIKGSKCNWSSKDCITDD